MALNTLFVCIKNRRVARFVDCMACNYQRRSLVAVRYVAIVFDLSSYKEGNK